MGHPTLGGLIMNGSGWIQFPLFVTAFPQQKITRTTSIPVGGEYYWFQRKSDLPEGESGLAAVSENRQRDSVRATGNGWRLEKLLQRMSS